MRETRPGYTRGTLGSLPGTQSSVSLEGSHAGPAPAGMKDPSPLESVRRAPAARSWTERTYVTLALIAFLAWLPLQTPLDLIAFQYGHLSAHLARGVLLLKDAFVALLIITLFLRHHRELRLRWFDWLGILYLILVIVYAAVPWFLGSRPSLFSVAASIREFVLPVELYALGRLAIIAGADAATIVLASIGIAIVAAAFTVGMYLFVPVTVWDSTLNLVTFVHEVQGIPTAISLYAISLLGQYGVGETGVFPRAVGPFTHPVGTAHYFVFPLVLLIAAILARITRSKASLPSGNLPRARIGFLVGGVLLLIGAVITPISRGAWLAAGVAAVVLGLYYRRLTPVLAAGAVMVVLLAFVPPYSYSISSALKLSDSSAIGHLQAVQQAIKVIGENPLGLGAGQGNLGAGQSPEASPQGSNQQSPNSATGANQPLASSDSAGIGEDMYLSLLVTVGPLGTLAFLGWMLGLILNLFARVRDGPNAWMVAACGATLIGYAFSSILASPLMRFTNAASFWLLCGLLVVNPGGGGLGIWAEAFKDALNGVLKRMRLRPSAVR